MRGLGAPEASGVHLVFDRWAEVVGESLAARTRPLRIEGDRLVLAVDEPAMATHVRFLQAELLARLDELLGPRSRDRAGPPRRAEEVGENAVRAVRNRALRLVDCHRCDFGL